MASRQEKYNAVSKVFTRDLVDTFLLLTIFSSRRPLALEHDPRRRYTHMNGKSRCFDQVLATMLYGRDRKEDWMISLSITHEI